MSDVIWVIPTKGDAVRRRITIDRTKSNMPDSVVLTKGWLTVREKEDDADPPQIEKQITTTDVPGTGQIEDNGAGGSNPVIRLDLEPDDTKAIGTLKDAGPDGRRFDVQVLASDGYPYTVENGHVYCEHEEVTRATS